MKKSSFLRHSLVVACMALVVPALSAQTSIQLFGPVNVRASVDGTTYDAPNTFNSNTLNLTCPGSPTGVLSSANGGNLLVDNNIQVSTSSPSMTGPTNVCTGGTADGSNADCFTTTYQSAASAGQLTGRIPIRLPLRLASPWPMAAFHPSTFTTVSLRARIRSPSARWTVAANLPVPRST